MRDELSIIENRKAIKYSAGEQALRLLWGMCRPIFRFSPRTFFSLRNFLLRLFGAKVGQGVHIYNTATIYMPWNLAIGDWSAIGEHALIYNLGLVSIGSKATVSHRAHLCAGTHDYTKLDLPLLKPGISIGDEAWICADAFIGPGIEIGQGAVVGARGVAVNDVQPWTIVAGNPAKYIKKRVLDE